MAHNRKVDPDNIAFNTNIFIGFCCFDKENNSSYIPIPLESNTNNNVKKHKLQNTMSYLGRLP